MFRQERYQRTGQRGSLELPLETPCPFGIPQALLYRCGGMFRVVIGTDLGDASKKPVGAGIARQKKAPSERGLLSAAKLGE